MKLRQWVILDANVFREMWPNNSSLLKYTINDNGDGTQFHSFEIAIGFPDKFIIAASANLTELLDPMLAIPYVDRPHPPPTAEETARRLSRDEALREWHTNPSIKMDFETYFRMRQRREAAE